MATEIKREFSRLFEVFLPVNADRFSELLERDPKHWRKIDPWAAWDIKKSPLITPWPRGLMFAKVASKWPAMARYCGKTVAVLRCGHSEPSLTHEPLGSIFSGQSHILDGFVSIEPGVLGLVLNHSGDVIVLSSSPLTLPSSGPPAEAAHVKR